MSGLALKWAKEATEASTAREAEIEAQAREAAERARRSMALSGQAISDAARERVVAYAIAKRLKR
jgi:hypothetical protein